MQIYFGAVPQDEVFDADAMFVSEHDNNNYFYYGVEYGSNPGGTDEVLVYDGLGRQVPVGIEDVPAMIAALELVYTTHQALERDTAELEQATANLENLHNIITSDDETATISPDFN